MATENTDSRITELENQVEVAERKADILTNLLKEANAEYEQGLEKIRVSETNFRAIFENAPEAIYIIDANTRIFLDCNPFMVNWLGFSRDELLSMKLDDIFEGSVKGEIQKAIEKLTLDGVIHGESRFYKKKNGTVTEAEVTGTLLEFQGKKAVAILVRDISQRRQIEALGKYKELFENVSDPVFINDIKGNFMETNDVACEVFGYTRTQMLKMNLGQMTAADDLQVLDKLKKQPLFSKTPFQFELNLLTRRGQPLPFELQGRVITHKKQPAFLSVARNLIVRKQLYKTLIKTERLSAVGEMASGVAHNFNNLLQMITAGAEAAQKKLEAGNIRDCYEAINNIISASQRGGDVVRRIKDFTLAGEDNIKAGQVFDMGELVDEAVELTRPMWHPVSDPRKYSLNIDKVSGCWVKGVSSEIYEVLVNLIINGLDAMAEGGTLTLATQNRNGQVQLIVRDTGCGIPEENLKRIFEPFFTTKGTQSSGLGLSSCYGIIKKFKGDIHVNSRLGQGTQFTVSLPLVQSEILPGNTSGKEIENIPIRFLLIDDEENILKSMALYFEGTEVELTTAASAAEGLQKFRNACFDVILCDFGMDDMNGLEIAAAIRDNDGKQNIIRPLFFLYTGLDTAIDAAELKASGVEQVVNKPTSCQELLSIIRSAVAGRKH